MFALLCLACTISPQAGSPQAAPGVTSLTNPEVKYRASGEPTVVLERAGVRAVIVDNRAVDTPELPGHRAGYNGIASLTHRNRDSNLFVPEVAGLNFEHIHDGTTAALVEKFEPRKFPMELRIVDEHTVEVYQPPTGHWKLESCGRYQMLEDGVIEYTFECIPRAAKFRDGLIGLFWASYIHEPEDKAIHFIGRRLDRRMETDWLRMTSPTHGRECTHGPAFAPELPPIDDDFPLTLVNHPSAFVYEEPWYYGVSHGMALVQMFRNRDRIWMAQSPTGGGRDNPAWDFQWFIRGAEVDKAYGFVMRMACLPFESRQQLDRDTRRHRVALR